VPRTGDTTSLESFVHGALGCTCPDEVFQSVRIRNPEAVFTGLSQGFLIDIGGRLLVLIIEVDHWEALSPRLETLLAQGRRFRDAEGFNRFRLVIATPEVAAARAALTRQFNALANRDERLHLHVLSPGVLPLLARE
jgi:hypothetical protein